MPEAAKTNGLSKWRRTWHVTRTLDEVDWMELELAIDRNLGFIVDYHARELFPERWFDLIVVMHADPNGREVELEGYAQTSRISRVKSAASNFYSLFSFSSNFSIKASMYLSWLRRFSSSISMSKTEFMTVASLGLKPSGKTVLRSALSSLMT